MISIYCALTDSWWALEPEERLAAIDAARTLGVGAAEYPDPRHYPDDVSVADYLESVDTTLCDIADAEDDNGTMVNWDDTRFIVYRTAYLATRARLTQMTLY